MIKSNVKQAARADLELEKTLLEGLNARSGDSRAALDLARLYLRFGRPIDVLHRIDSAAVQLSADGEVHREACQILLEIGAFEAAVRQAAKGLALSNRANLMALHEKALRRLVDEAGSGLSPSMKRAYLKGMDRLARKKPAAAADLFNKVLRSAPHYDAAWIGLRGALQALGDEAGVAAMAERWTAAVPGAEGRVRIGMARALSPDGLIFDPRTPRPFMPMRDVLAPVGSLAELEASPAGLLMLDPGGVAQTMDPVISMQADGSDRVVLQQQTAEVYVAGLDNAALLGRGAILNQDGVLLRELHGANLDKYGVMDLGDKAAFDSTSFQGGLGEVKVYDTPALLMCGATDKSFGDWVINFIPRLAIARQAGLTCPVVVSAKAPEPFIELLKAFGLTDKDIILHDRNGVSLFRKLYVPSWPMRDFLKPMADLFDVYRDLALPASGGPGRRIYLSREQVARRGMINEREVRDLFVRHGFEVVHPQDVGLARMREILADAEFVAAPYGSAMLNLAFAGRKPVSIVCQPPQKPGFLAQISLWQAAMGLCFAYVLGQPVGDPSQFSAKDAPWVAPLPELERVVEKVLKGAKRR